MCIVIKSLTRLFLWTFLPVFLILLNRSEKSCQVSSTQWGLKIWSEQLLWKLSSRYCFNSFIFFIFRPFISSTPHSTFSTSIEHYSFNTSIVLKLRLKQGITEYELSVSFPTHSYFLDCIQIINLITRYIDVKKVEKRQVEIQKKAFNSFFC